MKLAYRNNAIFFNFATTLSHLHRLQVENCDSISGLVVYEDDNDKFRIERVNTMFYIHVHIITLFYIHVHIITLFYIHVHIISLFYIHVHIFL